MATVSVLYIADHIVGPHLQLLRYVCEPKSRSRPHVTVGYFDKLLIPPQHLKKAVSHIDLLEPSSFNLDLQESVNRTVYIRCRSDELVDLEYKPHFPTSEFHVTLYDGRSRDFALGFLSLLKTFDWRFRVELPHGTHLSKVRIKARRRKRPAYRTYPSAIRSLFHEITGAQLTFAHLRDLSDEERLTLCRSICEHLHRASSGLPRVNLDDRLASIEHSSPESGLDVHLTPPELARDIAEYVVSLLPSDAPVDFGDPAVGTGAFFSALRSVVPDQRIRSAIGIDINPSQVAAAMWRWSHRGLQVLNDDYLHMERLASRSVVIANPPYRRHQDIRPLKYKNGLRERASVVVGMPVDARSGLYVYFLLLSHSWMARDAIAAWLIPGEFMQTSYGSVIRSYLTHSVRLLRVHVFDHSHPQFENAKVRPAVVVFRNERPKASDFAVFSAGGRLSRPSFRQAITISDLRADHRWTIPRRESHQTISSICVGDVFTIRRGIATGANEYFIMERDVAAKRGLPKTAVRPVLPKIRALNTTIIARCPDGYPKVSPQLCLLDCDLAEVDIARRYPRFKKYLDLARDLGILERHLLRDRNPWYKQEPRNAAMFLCTYMGRGNGDSLPLRFIWNKSDAVATNTYLMLYPRGRLPTLLRSKPRLAAELFDVLERTARESLSELSRTYAEGLRKIEPGDLRNVPLADPPEWLVREAHLDVFS